MLDKLRNDKFLKDLLIKVVTILFVAALALLVFDILTQSKDGRRQIVDLDGGTEYTEFDEDTLATLEEKRLEKILSQIKGVGTVNVMITYQDMKETTVVFNDEASNDNPRVEGVIVTAEGAGDVIIKNDIINAVAAVFDIPAANVMVFEKSDNN